MAVFTYFNCKKCGKEYLSTMIGECPHDKRTVDVLKEDNEFMEGIRQGVSAAKKGKKRKWEDIKSELRSGK